MMYENGLRDILEEAYGEDYENKEISKEDISDLVKLLELKLNLYVNNIDEDEYCEEEAKINLI